MQKSHILCARGALAPPRRRNTIAHPSQNAGAKRVDEGYSGVAAQRRRRRHHQSLCRQRRQRRATLAHATHTQTAARLFFWVVFWNTVQTSRMARSAAALSVRKQFGWCDGNTEETWWWFLVNGDEQPQALAATKHVCSEMLNFGARSTGGVAKAANPGRPRRRRRSAVAASFFSWVKLFLN